MLYDSSPVGFSNISDSKAQIPTTNGQNMSPQVTKKSPKLHKSDVPKVVKQNPAASNVQAAAKNRSRIEIHLPSQRDYEAALSAKAKQTLKSPVPVQPKATSPTDLAAARPPQPLPEPYVAADQPPSLAPPPPNPLSDDSERPKIPPKPVSKESQIVGLSIELPAATFDKSEFAIVEDSADAPVHLSTKRHRTELQNNENLLDGGLNNRQRANGALKDLQRCLQDFFEAEDLVSGQQAGSNPWVALVADQQPALTTAAYDRVQKLLLKTIDLGCFRIVPVEALQRLQSLCEGSLRQTESQDLKIDESWGEIEVGMWIQSLSDVEAGLKAARTALTVMCGGREEKQLYSEDSIQQGLDLFKNVMDNIVIPVAEMRSSGATSKLFKLLQAQKKPISTMFTACQKLFALMSTLNTSIDLSETVLNTLEFTSSRLIFVENAYTERDSVVGVQKFDGVRLVAMDMLSQIFLTHPTQRQGIFDDILSSLEKLPKGKIHARQFKLADGGSIQPVTALIMRLVQASAGRVHDKKGPMSGTILQSLQEGDEGHVELPMATAGSTEMAYTVRTEEMAAIQHNTAIQELEALSRPLFDTAQRNASYVVNYIVKRALGVAKTSEQNTPRAIFDLFVEDFTTCLDSPDWPAAELLLRMTMYMMLDVIKGDKHNAPAKNMALEILGLMAAAISKLRSHVRKTTNTFEGSDADELGYWLADLSSMALEQKHSPEKITGWLGPYRVLLEYLEGRVRDDPHLRSAISCMVTDWATDLCMAYDEENQEDDEQRDAEYGRIAYRLRNMIEDRRWLASEYSFKSVAANHARLSHSIILLRSQFCGSFKIILGILMQSMTTDAATVRSKSLKSITQVLETDPSILDGDSVVIGLILTCSNDSSPQVRDSALGLIGKCILMRPNLEAKMTETIIQRFVDTSVAVRKRAMKLARDIYLGNESRDVRSDIANGLLHRSTDPDEGVKELARQMVEEVWIAPFYKADESTAYRQALTNHVALIVQTVKQGNSSLALDKMFQTILSDDAKLANANSQVCTRLVANMFDLVDNPDSDDPSTPSGKDALQVLMIFAKAEPRLFTFEQIRLLQPRIASVGTSEDLAVSRAVVVIYRRVLPQVSKVHSQFLAEIRKELMPCVSKVTRTLLDDLFACLWIISELLETSVHLARLVCSSMVQIQQIRALSTKGPLDQQSTRKFDRYALIVGMAGKHCDLDSHEEFFRTKFPKWKDKSVSKLMVDVLIPFASPSQPAELRKPALDAIGLVCQSNPRNFVAPNVYTTFQQVFDEQIPALESMILRSFKEFLLTEEKRSEEAAAAAKSSKDEAGHKDLKIMGSTTFDDVASATCQRFLKEINRITIATQDEHALLATEVLTSISRQGLTHPKETGVTLITLETCPIARISEMALREHRSIHQKHETVIEREYTRAVQSAFQYQRDVVHDPRGATANPFTSKLHHTLGIMKDSSNAKSRQRFLLKLVNQIDFDMSKFTADEMTDHAHFSRFLVENLAFFDYVALSDLQATVVAMEKMVHNTGSGIAQSIEADIFQLRVDMILGPQAPADVEAGQAQTDAPAAPLVDTDRLRQLTASSMILLAVWEARAYLRKLYNLGKIKAEIKAKVGGKGKMTANDLAKAPVKVAGVTGDKFWVDMSTIMTGLDSQERMMETCKSFVELMNVDNELKINDGDDDAEGDGELGTPEPYDEDEDDMGDGRGRKRKASDTPGGRKKRARSNSRTKKSRGRPRKNPAPDEMEVAEDDMDWA